jgi:carboxyl-terminal processing protease
MLENLDSRYNKRKRKPIKIILIVLILITTNICSLYIGKSYAIINNSASNSESFNKIGSIKQLLQKYYLGDTDDETMLNGALKGMASSLNDPYTVFMDKKDYESFNTETEGSYIGVGIQVGVKDDKITVITTFEKSPSREVGILSGDIIQEVDGKPVKGSDLELAVSMMKGEEGKDVKVNLYREGKGSFDVTMKRAKINLTTVKGEMLDDKNAYIQISMFDEQTGKELKNVLKDLKDKGMKSLIVDLRDNPGGRLDACIDVMSNFLDKGKVIVSTKDKYDKEYSYKSVGGEYIGLPLVVLTNGGTASASEIFSGAVRDYKLGTLVGEKTFGKGIVQTVLDLKDGTALKVTVSKYYTPNGENIHKIGISPDVTVEYPKELLQDPNYIYSREKDPQFKKAVEIINNVK